MLQRQKRFQNNFFDADVLNDADKIKWTKEFVLATHQELAEVMDSLDWKSYHAYKTHQYSVDDTKEEIIDCFKFILNLMIVWGITESEALELFNKKSDLVETRLKLK